MHTDEDDREDLVELREILQKALDKSHWLSVHRRLGMARHIEDSLQHTIRMVDDLRGQHQRGDVRGFPMPQMRDDFAPPDG